jgi:hypothetical protein
MNRTMDYYLAIKKNEMINLENTKPVTNATYCMIPFI